MTLFWKKEYRATTYMKMNKFYFFWLDPYTLKMTDMLYFTDHHEISPAGTLYEEK